MIGIPISATWFSRSPRHVFIFLVLVGDALQEQYELVYKAVLELFKRQMDVIRDRHSGTEVNFELDVLLIFKKMFDLVRGS